MSFEKLPTEIDNAIISFLGNDLDHAQARATLNALSKVLDRQKQLVLGYESDQSWRSVAMAVPTISMLILNFIF